MTQCGDAAITFAEVEINGPDPQFTLCVDDVSMVEQ
jgi:hypothetical protein